MIAATGSSATKTSPRFNPARIANLHLNQFIRTRALAKGRLIFFEPRCAAIRRQIQVRKKGHPLTDAPFEQPQPGELRAYPARKWKPGRQKIVAQEIFRSSQFDY